MTDQVYQDRILAITFTNKGVGVMRERLADESITDTHCTTFHKLAVNILRQTERRFTIYDEADQNTLLRKIMKDEHIPKDELSAIKEYIGHKKDNLISCEVDSGDYSRVYSAYQEALGQHNALDFDDLIYAAVVTMGDDTFCASQQARWDHILVDETQDTSHAQWTLLTLLKGHRRCLFAVFDIDQCIYAWRGARPQNILDFISKHNPTVINMGTNYRSHSGIIRHASMLIKYNEDRIDKRLASADPEPGPTPILHYYYDSYEEARGIADICHRARRYSGVAILYRSNWMAGQIEMALRRDDVPYQVKDTVRFFERQEVKDAVSYFRVLWNPRDKIAVSRSISSPKRGIGEKTLATIHSLDDLKATKFKGKKKLIVDEYLSLVDRISKVGIRAGLQLLYDNTDNLGYEDTNRITNLRQLLTLAQGKTLEEFVVDTSLDDTDETRDGDAVTLMTMHSAKGTEYPEVIIVGCEEGITPHKNNNNLQEERRLFYVAMTRPEQTLHITVCRRRSIFGTFTDQYPSRFLREAGIH